MPAWLLSPWAIRFGALIAGLAAGLAHPPFGFLPGFLGYALLLAVVHAPDPRPLKAAFFRGWLAGLGYFAVSVWWVVDAFLVDAAVHGWMAPFALALLAGGLALFWGLGLTLYRATRARGLLRVLVFAGALSATEWLRSHIFTGFPWNLPGETWRAGSAASQLAAVVGPYALTWVTLTLSAAPVLLFDPMRHRRRAIIAGVLVLAAVGLHQVGAQRLKLAPPPAPEGPRIRVVQANIDQKNKWRPENLELIFATYERLTVQRDRVDIVPDIVVWPEGALPAVADNLLAPGSPYVRRFQNALSPGQTLLMGANRAGLAEDGRSLDYFNSLIALRRESDGLRVTGVYDKHRLVPFGEFLPLGDLMTLIGFRSLVHMPEDFSAGPAPRPMTLPGLPSFQPMICYEALFPRLAARQGAPRPQWILNVSNDAWFGVTSGPLQHLNLASYRAIEEGLPMVRATPTGVSAFIDAHGRVLPNADLGLSKLGVIDATLPPSLAPTPYSRHGDKAFLVMLALSALTGLIFAVRRT